MSTQQMTRAPSGAEGTGSIRCRPDRGTGHDEAWLSSALRSTADRRMARAAALRDWSLEVHPPLAQSLRRRAAELELGAVALDLRADGMDGGRPAAHDEAGGRPAAHDEAGGRPAAHDEVGGLPAVDDEEDA